MEPKTELNLNNARKRVVEPFCDNPFASNQLAFRVHLKNREIPIPNFNNVPGHHLVVLQARGLVGVCQKEGVSFVQLSKVHDVIRQQGNGRDSLFSSRNRVAKLDFPTPNFIRSFNNESQIVVANDLKLAIYEVSSILKSGILIKCPEIFSAVISGRVKNFETFQNIRKKKTLILVSLEGFRSGYLNSSESLEGIPKSVILFIQNLEDGMAPKTKVVQKWLDFSGGVFCRSFIVLSKEERLYLLDYSLRVSEIVEVDQNVIEHIESLPSGDILITYTSKIEEMRMESLGIDTNAGVPGVGIQKVGIFSPLLSQISEIPNFFKELKGSAEDKETTTYYHTHVFRPGTQWDIVILGSGSNYYKISPFHVFDAMGLTMKLDQIEDQKRFSFPALVEEDDGYGTTKYRCRGMALDLSYASAVPNCFGEINMHPASPLIFAVSSNGKLLVSSFVKDDETNAIYSSNVSRAETQRNVVTSLVSKDFNLFERASKSIKQDDLFIMRLVKKGNSFANYPSFVLSFTSKSIRSNQNIIKLAVQNHHDSFQFASKSLKNNRFFILEIVKLRGMQKESVPCFCLEYANEKFRDDYEVILTAVKCDGRALRFASEKLKKNLKIVGTAVSQSFTAFEYVDEDMMKNRSIAAIVLKRWARNYRKTDPEEKEFPLEISSPKEIFQISSKEKRIKKLFLWFVTTMDDDHQKKTQELEEAKKLREETSMKMFQNLLETEEKFASFQTKIGTLETSLAMKEKIFSLRKKTHKNSNNQLKLLSICFKKESENLIELNLFERSFFGKSLRDFRMKRKIHPESLLFEVEYQERPLAVKIIKKDSTKFSSIPSILQRLPPHSSILRIHFYNEIFDNSGWESVLCEDNNTRKCFLVMALCGKSLEDLMKEAGTKRPIFSDEIFFKFLKQVTNGLVVLRKRFIIHRNIKPTHILTLYGDFLIGGFECCFDASLKKNFVIQNSKEGIFKGGDVQFMPPEIKNELKEDDIVDFSKYDIYSLGVVCFKLFSLREPQCGMRLELNECQNEKIRDTVFLMMSPFKNRISLEQLVSKMRAF